MVLSLRTIGHVHTRGNKLKGGFRSRVRGYGITTKIQWDDKLMIELMRGLINYLEHMAMKAEGIG